MAVTPACPHTSEHISPKSDLTARLCLQWWATTRWTMCFKLVHAPGTFKLVAAWPLHAFRGFSHLIFFLKQCCFCDCPSSQSPGHFQPGLCRGVFGQNHHILSGAMCSHWTSLPLHWGSQCQFNMELDNDEQLKKWAVWQKLMVTGDPTGARKQQPEGAGTQRQWDWAEKVRTLEWWHSFPLPQSCNAEWWCSEMPHETSGNAVRTPMVVNKCSGATNNSRWWRNRFLPERGLILFHLSSLLVAIILCHVCDWIFWLVFNSVTHSVIQPRVHLLGVNPHLSTCQSSLPKCNPWSCSAFGCISKNSPKCSPTQTGICFCVPHGNLRWQTELWILSSADQNVFCRPTNLWIATLQSKSTHEWMNPGKGEPVEAAAVVEAHTCFNCSDANTSFVPLLILFLFVILISCSSLFLFYGLGLNPQYRFQDRIPSFKILGFFNT